MELDVAYLKYGHLLNKLYKNKKKNTYLYPTKIQIISYSQFNRHVALAGKYSNNNQGYIEVNYLDRWVEVTNPMEKILWQPT